MTSLTTDLRIAARGLLRSPGFTAAAVITIAIGTGMVAAVFSLLNGVVRGRLPFDPSERVVSLSLSAGRIDDLRVAQASFEGIAVAVRRTFNVRIDDQVTVLPGAYLSPDALDLLGVAPLAGRGFRPEDARAAGEPPILVSAAVWERHFARRSDILGTVAVVDGERYRVAGVMPADFGFPRNESVWLVLPAARPTPGGEQVVFGRLRPDSRAEAAAQELTTLVRHLARTDAEASALPPPVEVVPFARRGVKGAVVYLLGAILIASFLVLLLACTNVANLVLARSSWRSRDLALRSALGASRGRVVQLLMAESLWLAVMGSLAGFVLARAVVGGVWRYLQGEQDLTGGAPFWVRFDVDGRTLVFLCAVALLTAVASGLGPAMKVSSVGVNAILKRPVGMPSGLKVGRLSHLLIQTQMGLSVAVMVSAGLLVMVVVAASRARVPYDPEQVLTARIDFLDRREGAGPARQLESLLGRLAASAEVGVVAATTAPGLRPAPARVEIEGRSYRRPSDLSPVTAQAVTPRFFDVFAAELLAGRHFDESDAADAPPVAIVNAVFARSFWPTEGAAGRRFRVEGEGEQWVTVVGVSPDLGSLKAGRTTEGPAFYRPFPQSPRSSVTVVLRGRAEVASLRRALARELAAVDPNIAAARLNTAADIAAMERIGLNVPGVLFLMCGLAALALASVGVYAVVAFSVQERTREIGIRLALGASRPEVIRMLLRDGLTHVARGLGAGVLLAFVASLGLRGTVVGFGVSAFHVWIYAGVVGLLAAVAFTALLLPALRGARVDPMVAVRVQ